MIKNVQSQAEILKLVNQVKSDFNTLSSGHLKDHIKTCNPNSVSNTEMKIPLGGMAVPAWKPL
nr:OMP684 [Helicobacter acinonychis]SFZ70804.1 OMP1294 [Helicobacter acinonychis]